MDNTLLVILCLTSLSLSNYAFSSHNSHVVDIQALTAKSVCSASKDSGIVTLKVVDRYGPCSTLPPVQRSIQQMLSDDQSRVDAIHHRVSAFSGKDKTSDPLTSSQITAEDGSSYHAGNYIVSVGIGTPSQSLTLIFDTGSDITWVQCQPCQQHCYSQQESIFDPSQSSTFANVSCASNACKVVSYGCSGSSCLYHVGYGDGSYTLGYYAEDTLTITPDVIQNFRFGCGQNNSKGFGEVAGLLALGPKDESFVSQTTDEYQGVFSYCLPSSSSSTGYLNFGRGSDMSNTYSTPIPKNPNQAPDFYYITMTGISVDGEALQIDATVFSNAGMIIDSGTIITRLPPDAYEALRSAFRKRMTQYPMVSGDTLLDTCYDFTGYNTVEIPPISVQFLNDASLDLDQSGIIYHIEGTSQYCLAFASNSDPSKLAIFGNTQQRTFNVLYDIPNGEIGFSPQAC